jgi:hypothetical protein
MQASSTSRDPRTIVTPEAFHVSPHLLGLELASPRRRLAAIMLDLLFIGILTAVTRSFALVLGIVVSAALLRASTKRTTVRGNVFDRARRFSIGCLGLFIGMVTLLAGVVIILDNASESVGSDFTVDFGSAAVAVQGDPSDEEALEPRDADAIRDGVTLYSTEEALEAYAALLRSGSSTETDRELRLALEARLAQEVAADTLSRLRSRVEDLEDDLSRSAARLEATQEALEEAAGGGFWGFLGGLVDELGFGFGWAALYTTVLLTVTNGQTPGKRMLGIRVLRLDGQRITWWVAFERAGGYAAGFATGLLGFAQVWWDGNRQAIHDRIVGTVVVSDGAERVHDWEEAL